MTVPELLANRFREISRMSAVLVSFLLVEAVVRRFVEEWCVVVVAV